MVKMELHLFFFTWTISQGYQVVGECFYKLRQGLGLVLGVDISRWGLACKIKFVHLSWKMFHNHFLKFPIRNLILKSQVVKCPSQQFKQPCSEICLLKDGPIVGNYMYLNTHYKSMIIILFQGNCLLHLLSFQAQKDCQKKLYALIKMSLEHLLRD